MKKFVNSGQFVKGFIPWNKGKKTGNIPWNKGLSVRLNPDGEFKKGHKSPAKGKQLLHLRGKNACNWQGGKTPENQRIRNSSEFALWRKSIFSIDNFICQKCDESGGILNAHHINNFADFPELRLNLDNGITLCKKCHKKFHSKYGIKNNTKEQIIEFLENNKCQ